MTDLDKVLRAEEHIRLFKLLRDDEPDRADQILDTAQRLLTEVVVANR